jgi:flavin reductase (DIM6/NTAB) family NADH-FMN oxidoreductase RutF
LFYDATENKHGLRRDPFKALVCPRPIGWISTVAADGVLNLAPYSFFNALSDNPHYVYFSSAGCKDSQRNAEEMGEFVCSLATWELREQMNVTSAGVDPDVDEFEIAGLTPAPSSMVAPPRVAESPVALECKYYQSLELPRETGRNDYTVVIGRVVGIYIDDNVIADGKIDMARLRPIARLGYMDYAVVDTIFSLDRPK